jgi:SAM-dependent methyltransferase
MPEVKDGFYAFSPSLSENNDGMYASSHHILDQFQDKSFWFRERNQLIQNIINRYFPNALTVLEVGCGSGYVLSGIRKVLPNARLTATEIYSSGLSYAAQRVAMPTEFLQADARKLPFKQEFNLVGAFDVLEHIDDDELALQNIRESLKPGGGVVLTVPQHPFLWSKVDEAACHKRRYTRHQLANMLVKFGFEILCDTSFMFFLLPMVSLQRLISSKKKNYQPDHELTLPILLDKTFATILTLERWMIKLGCRFPAGSSRLLAARLRD